jgi:hypothetical protein
MTDSTIDPTVLLRRVFVTVMLLTILAGPDAKVLRRLTIHRDPSFVSTVYLVGC